MGKKEMHVNSGNCIFHNKDNWFDSFATLIKAESDSFTNKEIH